MASMDDPPETRKSEFSGPESEGAGEQRVPVSANEKGVADEHMPGTGTQPGGALHLVGAA